MKPDALNLPRPKFLSEFCAPYLREEFEGVVLEYWGKDEEVQKRLTDWERLELATVPTHMNALSRYWIEHGRVLQWCLRFGVTDQAGKYSLWRVTADCHALKKEASPATQYVINLSMCIQALATQRSSNMRVRPDDFMKGN